MTEDFKAERRRYLRYDSKIDLAFYVSFELTAKIDFRVKKENETKFSRARYLGVTKNINAEGLCFETNIELCKRDLLSVEMFLPSRPEPILMEGKVRWSRLMKPHQGVRPWETGVKIVSLSGEDVEKSLIFDEIHKIYWSRLLETVFGENKEQLTIFK